MIEDPDRVTAMDIMTRLRIMHDNVQQESWTDERAKTGFLSGIRACVTVIDKEYLQGE